MTIRIKDGEFIILVNGKELLRTKDEKKVESFLEDI